MLSSGQQPDLLNNLVHQLLFLQLQQMANQMFLGPQMEINKIEVTLMIKIETGELNPIQGLIIK